jgi:hypothetical protein
MPESIKRLEGFAAEDCAPEECLPHTSGSVQVAPAMKQSEQKAADIEIPRPAVSPRPKISNLRTMQSSRKSSLSTRLCRLTRNLFSRVMNWRAELAMLSAQ